MNTASQRATAQTISDPYFAEQLRTADVSVFHHRVTFKPQQIVPDIDFRSSAEELGENASEANQ